MINEFILNFHFLRPYWLIAILPALLLCVFLWKTKRGATQWQGIIAPQLLKVLIEKQQGDKNHWHFFGLCCLWSLTAIALAGPSWQRIPQPVHRSQAPVVILFDLSPSMLAEDLRPSRLVRARYKLLDFLEAREDGLNALIAYGGEAYVVSPLTDDTETIANLMPAMDPSLMPLRGSNIEMAVEKALEILVNAGLNKGEILAVTDGIDPAAFENIKMQLSASNIRFSALGVGTSEGAPIPTGDGGFTRGSSGEIVIPKLNKNEISQITSTLGGRYVDLRTDNQDIDLLLEHFHPKLDENQSMETDRQFDVWEDKGQWLALILLPFILISFRRGWLLSFAFIVIVMPEPSYAFGWDDLWLRSDQQAQKSFQQGDVKDASEKFTRPDWQGTAHYKSENFEVAAEKFSQNDTAQNHYNRGNALAKSGELEAAVEAYEQSLALDTTNENATFNRDLVKDVLKQQQEQQNQGQQQDQENKDKKKGDQNDQESDSSENPSSGSNQESEEENQDQENSQQSDSNSEDEKSAQELADREQQAKKLSDEEIQERKEAEQQRKESGEESDQQGDEETQQMLAEMSEESAEDQQSLEQWLRQVPDDPSGLLRRKFDYQHRELRRNYRRGDWIPPENQSYERW